jgi:hypothetical protein
MRAISRLAIGAAILVSATVPVLAGSMQSSVHGSSNPGIQPAAHGGATPLARKITTPKGCYQNCMRGGMREDFCTLSCY